MQFLFVLRPLKRNKNKKANGPTIKPSKAPSKKSSGTKTTPLHLLASVYAEVPSWAAASDFWATGTRTSVELVPCSGEGGGTPSESGSFGR